MARKKKTEEKPKAVKVEKKPKAVKAEKKSKEKTPVKEVPKPEKEEKEVSEEAKKEVKKPKKVASTFVDAPKSRCVSCGAYVIVGSGSVKFSCPNCDAPLGRCSNCRTLARSFTCTCGFVGP